MDSGKVKIHGKEYKTVALRVNEFRERFYDYAIETDLVSNNDLVVIKAIVKNEGGRVLATGYAEEARGSTKINATSALENCETSAIGRALACLGLAGTEYASADEVSGAILQQREIEAKKAVGNYFTSYNEAVRNNIENIYQFKSLIANNDLQAAAGSWLDINTDERALLVKLAPTKGGILSTEEREVITKNGSMFTETIQPE